MSARILIWIFIQRDAASAVELRNLRERFRGYFLDVTSVSLYIFTAVASLNSHRRPLLESDTFNLIELPAINLNNENNNPEF